MASNAGNRGMRNTGARPAWAKAWKTASSSRSTRVVADRHGAVHAADRAVVQADEPAVQRDQRAVAAPRAKVARSMEASGHVGIVASGRRAPCTIDACSPCCAPISWQEVRHHAWRSATAVLAVMLGVALALFRAPDQRVGAGEFSSAARSVGGQPDLELRAAQGAASTKRCTRAWPPTRRWPPPARCWNCRPMRWRPTAARTAARARPRPWWWPPLAPALVPQPSRGADRWRCSRRRPCS
jgi:hypothetical protein